MRSFATLKEIDKMTIKKWFFLNKKFECKELEWSNEENSPRLLYTIKLLKLIQFFFTV